LAGSGGTGYGAGGFSGDGGPATQAQLAFPEEIVVGQGALYIADTSNHRVRKLTPGGIITTVAGTGPNNDVNCYYGGFSGDGGPAPRARLSCPLSVAVDAPGDVYIADNHNGRVRKLVSALPGFSAQDVTIPSTDGSEVYQFSGSGRHVRTVDTLTGATRYSFGYDSQGRLSSITDGDGNVTQMERDGGGHPTAILAPFGQRTALTLGANGYLATITNPAGETHRFTYSTDGLLQTMATPRTHEYRFTYDAFGRLTRDENPAGGFKALSGVQAGSNTVTLTTALNRASTYLVESRADGSTRRVDTAPDGTQTELILGADARRTTTTPDGTITTLTQGPDPRFRMQAPILESLTVRLPSGRTATSAMTRAVALGDPNNPLSLTSQTDTITLNGRTATSA